MVVHLAAAAHHIAHIGNLVTVAGAAGDGVLFKYVYVFAGHLAVAHQVAGRCQRAKAAADDISRLVVDTFRLARPGECFVVPTGIIHKTASVSLGLGLL